MGTILFWLFHIVLLFASILSRHVSCFAKTKIFLREPLRLLSHFTLALNVGPHNIIKAYIQYIAISRQDLY